MGNPSTGKRKRQSWEDSYNDLKEYHKIHGHCNVPVSYPILGRWANRNRNERNDHLTQEQRAKLDALGFDWETQEQKDDRAWLEMYERLKRYKREHASCHVKQKEQYEGKPLGLWVSYNRTKYKNGRLKADRKEKLESIGFLWIYDDNMVWKDDRNRDKIDNVWNRKFELLNEYQREKGHCLVPRGFTMVDYENNNHDIGAWVATQRELHRRGNLRQERKEQLETLGFVWTVDPYDAKSSLNQRRWDEMYNRLLHFKRTHGHCRVPFSYKDKDGATLGRWADVQRTRLSTERLDDNRFERLQILGFEFYSDEASWNSMYQHLKAYKAKHGHSRVPTDFTTVDGANLGTWVSAQRSANKSGKVVGAHAEKKAKLDALSFVWDDRSDRWKHNFRRLKKFHKAHGHCRVPKDYDDGKETSLSGFVSEQRRTLYGERKKDDSVSRRRIELLETIDFPWVVPTKRI